MLRLVKDNYGVTCYNYDNETCNDVFKNAGQYVVRHKDQKPFALRDNSDKRWYKIKDLPPQDPTDYLITQNDVNFNVNIKFYYMNVEEKFIEIPQGIDIIHPCTVMGSEAFKHKLLFFNETVVPPVAACSIQGGKNKHKSYRRKRQQRRSHGHKRTRTYKHRKMFHKGGKDMPLIGNPPPVKFAWDGDEGRGIILNLRYTEGNKNKFDTFNIGMTINDRNDYTFTFTKIGGKSRFSFNFKDSSEDSVVNQVYSAIKFGEDFVNMTPVENDVTYKFIADENLAIGLRDSINGIRTFI